MIKPKDGKRPSVVIIGAGFAGINAAHMLARADVDITIVDRNNFHTFQPLLYQVATSYLSPEEVGASVRAIFRSQENVSFRVGEVVGVDWEQRNLKIENDHDEHFDFLVVAGGATVNYFGIPGMKESSWPLYTLHDSVLLRQHLLWRLEEGAKHEGGREPETVVVVGGGPTGIETAGAIASMAHDLLGQEERMLHVVLVEALPNVLGAFAGRSQKRAMDDLRRRGVEVRLGTTVKAADETGVELEGEGRIETRTVVWAAGVSSGPIGATLGLETGRRNAVIVGQDLQVADRPNVFAAGDIATIVPEPEAGQPPLLAPNAIQGGKHVARQIRRILKGEPTKPYKYFDKGMMAVLGRGNAVVELPVKTPFKTFHLRFAGRFAWLTWLGVHVVYLIGFRNRLKVIIDWGWNYFTSRGTEAIMLRREVLNRRWE